MPGKESEVENSLRAELPAVEEEPAATVWFALRLNRPFGNFDAFSNDEGPQAHLSGRIAGALKVQELLAAPFWIEQVDILAAKLPP